MASAYSAAEKDRARWHRADSVDDYLRYLCIATPTRTRERQSEKEDREFIRHCQDLYRKQGGLCAVSGLPLTCEDASPDAISIDRIDRGRGYVRGNCRLVARWV